MARTPLTAGKARRPPAATLAASLALFASLPLCAAPLLYARPPSAAPVPPPPASAAASPPAPGAGPPPRGIYALYRPAQVAPCSAPGSAAGPFGRFWEGTVPLPPGVGVPPSGSAEEILDAFLRIPYRKDGAVSEDGRNTLWADPSKSFPGPGLNCSGFMVAASRFLMGVNFTLDEAKRDISSDSGKGAPLGEDWDFGLDAALNLAGGGSVIFPWQGEYGRVEDGRGRPLGLGADVDGEGFVEALGRIVPGKLYFFAVSKPDARFGGGLSYYHNGIAIAARDGGVSLYHATGRGGVNRMRLSTPAGLATFRKYYPPLRSGKRRVVFIEASPPACAGPWAYQAQPPGAPQPQEAPGAPGLQALPNLPPVPPGPRAASIVSGVPGAEAGP